MPEAYPITSQSILVKEVTSFRKIIPRPLAKILPNGTAGLINSNFKMKRIENMWRVEPQGDNQSTVQLGVDVTLLPVFKQLLGGKLT